MEKKSNLPYVNVPETIGYPFPKEDTERALRCMADYIIDHTSYKFINCKTGEESDSGDKLPVSEDIKLKSGYNDWKYWNGVIHLSFRALADVLKDQKYIKYIKDNYAFAFKNLPYFRKLFDARIENANFHQFFRLDRLDDFGAMGAGLFEAIKESPKPEYKEYLEKVMKYIADGQDRLEDGTFCRNRFGYTALWGDDMYMSIPFLVRAWHYSRDEKYLEDAVHQVFQFKKYLYQPENGLYHHYRIMQAGHPGVAYWGRANGWMIVAHTELLNALPESHPKRDELIDILKERIVGLSRYQTGNGMWRQLLDKQDSFLESSSTAMFTYSIAKAVNEGWVDDIYASIAIAGWKGLVDHCIKPNGEFDKVSTGFNFKQDLAYYYNRPIEPGGDHGVGAAILAGTEIYKMKEYRDCVWC